MSDEDRPPEDGGAAGHEPPANSDAGRRRVISRPGPPRQPRAPLELRGADVVTPRTEGSRDEQGRLRPPIEERGAEPPPANRLRPDLELREIRTGARPGSKYVRQ